MDSVHCFMERFDVILSIGVYESLVDFFAAVISETHTCFNKASGK